MISTNYFKTLIVFILFNVHIFNYVFKNNEVWYVKYVKSRLLEIIFYI